MTRTCKGCGVKRRRIEFGQSGANLHCIYCLKQGRRDSVIKRGSWNPERTCEVCAVAFVDPMRCGRPRTRCEVCVKKDRRKNDPARYAKKREYNRASNGRSRFKRYGLTREGAQAILDAQGGRCGVCRVALSFVRAAGPLHACVDHDHATGRVRGILCSRCNTGVGHFRDDPRLMRKAAAYLERDKAPAPAEPAPPLLTRFS